MPCHLPPSPDFSNNSSDFYLPPPQQPCILSYFFCFIFRSSFRQFFSFNFLFTVYCTRLDALNRFFHFVHFHELFALALRVSAACVVLSISAGKTACTKKKFRPKRTKTENALCSMSGWTMMHKTVCVILHTKWPKLFAVWSFTHA